MFDIMLIDFVFVNEIIKIGLTKKNQCWMDRKDD